LAQALQATAATPETSALQHRSATDDSIMALLSPGRGGGDAAANQAAALSELNLDSESAVLQAILDAIKDSSTTDAGDEGDSDMYADVQAALRDAERVAVSGVSDRASGQSVLRSHEVQSLGDQLKRARSTVGAPSCIDASVHPQKVAFAVGTSVGFV